MYQRKSKCIHTWNHIHTRSHTKNRECGADKVFIFWRQYDARHIYNVCIHVVLNVQTQIHNKLSVLVQGKNKIKIPKTKMKKKTTKHAVCVCVCIAQGGFSGSTYKTEKIAKQQTHA